jgi:hypothetical protein
MKQLVQRMFFPLGKILSSVSGLLGKELSMYTFVCQRKRADYPKMFSSHFFNDCHRLASIFFASAINTLITLTPLLGWWHFFKAIVVHLIELFCFGLGGFSRWPEIYGFSWSTAFGLLCPNVDNFEHQNYSAKKNQTINF